jgi:hypothetical protein
VVQTTTEHGNLIVLDLDAVEQKMILTKQIWKLPSAWIPI